MSDILDELVDDTAIVQTLYGPITQDKLDDIDAIIDSILNPENE